MGFKLFGKQIGKTAEQKHEEKMAKIENRTERVAIRQDTKKTAFEMGIDPNASMWGGISSLGGSIAQATSSIFGRGKNPTASAFGQNSVTGSNKDLLVYALIGLGIYFIFFKGKR